MGVCVHCGSSQGSDPRSIVYKVKGNSDLCPEGANNSTKPCSLIEGSPEKEQKTISLYIQFGEQKEKKKTSFESYFQFISEEGSQKYHMKLTPIPEATLNPQITELQMVVGQKEEEQPWFEILSFSGSNSLSKHSIQIEKEDVTLMLEEMRKNYESNQTHKLRQSLQPPNNAVPVIYINKTPLF